MHPTADSDPVMCIIPRSQTPWYDAHPKVGVHNGTLQCAMCIIPQIQTLHCASYRAQSQTQPQLAGTMEK